MPRLSLLASEDAYHVAFHGDPADRALFHFKRTLDARQHVPAIREDRAYRSFEANGAGLRDVQFVLVSRLLLRDEALLRFRRRRARGRFFFAFAGLARHRDDVEEFLEGLHTAQPRAL